MKRDAGWPRYMKAKTLASGAVAYYWAPHERDRVDGFTLGPEALGKDYAAAATRAGLLNEHLDAWREGKGLPEQHVDERRVGTIDWWHQQYFASDPFKALSPRSQSDYRDALEAIANIPTSLTDAATNLPVRTGQLQACSLSQAAVDKIYKRLRKGGTVTRQADYSIDVARRAWKVVRRQHPGLFLVPVTGPDGKVLRLAINPFEGVERADYERDTATPATRAQVLTFAQAATAAGQPALGIAALICFEWHQRPEDVVVAGRITWTDYRPADHPNKVRVFHHKTRKRVWKILEVTAGQDSRLLYPELEKALSALPRLGVPMIVFEPLRGPKGTDGKRTARLYSQSYAHHLVQDIRKEARLPSYFTLEACRHGGMTELGDAELTEQEIMTLSTHATPEAARIYVKRSEKQELSAAAKRRDYVDRKGTKRG